VGVGGCTGGQACSADGKSFGPCECSPMQDSAAPSPTADAAADAPSRDGAAPPDGETTVDTGAGDVGTDGGAAESDGAAGCPPGTTTTVSGTVYDPAGKVPLSGVVVYVPATPLQPLLGGASCYTCSTLYSLAATSALTEPDGSFVLHDVPAGDVSLVLQVGKWRRVLPVRVAGCADNPQPDRSLRLPKNAAEGDMPEVAIATGGGDSLECTLLRMGIDPGEFVGGPGGTGHVHLFEGDNGATTKPPAAPAPVASTTLWDSRDHLAGYDVVLLSCEGHETTMANPQALFDYTALGGRVLASHFHYAWFTGGPFAQYNLATWTPGTNPLNAADGGYVGAVVETLQQSGAPSPTRVRFQQWLTSVGALGVNGAPPGELPINRANHNADLGPSNQASTPWIVTDGHTTPPGAVQTFTFDTPLDHPPGQQCGRVAFSEMHVVTVAGDYGGGTAIGGPLGVFPDGCTAGDLSPQEKAIEFMMFDLSACVVPDDAETPLPP
jgi:hypothetical protein